MIEIPFPLFYSTQGDRGNGMYFVETGTLVVLKQIDGEEKEVKYTAKSFSCLIASLPGAWARAWQIFRRTRPAASRSQELHSGGSRWRQSSMWVFSYQWTVDTPPPPPPLFSIYQQSFYNILLHSPGCSGFWTAVGSLHGNIEEERDRIERNDEEHVWIKGKNNTF